MLYTDEFIKQGKFDKNSMFIKNNLVYECICGSHAYGNNNEDSDYDIVGLFMDRHQDLYPVHYGFIPGFDNISRFEQKENKGEDKRIILPHNNKPCEAEWHSLTDFFYKAGVKGSPNMIEILFVNHNFITFSHNISYILRDNRQKFLSMKTYHSFKGYLFSQMHRVKQDIKRGKTENPKRQIYLDKFGYDIKMAGHILRLADQIEQILTVGDIDLQRIREEVIAMRKAEWGNYEKFEKYIDNRLLKLEELAMKVPLSSQPRTSGLHLILQQCIEEFYGSVTKLQQTEYVSVKQLTEQLDRMEKNINSILKDK
jgi:hypothetical protein